MTFGGHRGVIARGQGDAFTRPQSVLPAIVDEVMARLSTLLE